MGQCKYCGRSAGFGKNMHSECDERHELAVAQIPDFFPKFFKSDLSLARFGELLRGAAQASFVSPDELSELAARGLARVVMQMVEQHLPGEADMQRLRDVAKAVAPMMTRDILPHELLAKVEILHELGGARVPDIVSVAGPMPIELGQGESVIWIFNDVTCFRGAVDSHDAPTYGGVAPVALSLAAATYYSPAAFRAALLPEAQLLQDATGDLVVTNRNLFFVNGTVEARRIPLARIAALSAYANGILVACDGSGAESRQSFSLDDSWFAANMLVRLFHLARLARAS
jgi:hypothetical protein